MRVLRVGFVGTRTAETAAMTSFFRNVLGLETVRDTPEWSILELPTGPHDYVEVYWADFDDERLCPSHAGLMVAFVVDDLDGAHADVVGAGMQSSPMVWAAQAFESPDLEGVQLVLCEGGRREHVRHPAGTRPSLIAGDTPARWPRGPFPGPKGRRGRRPSSRRTGRPPSRLPIRCSERSREPVLHNIQAGPVAQDSRRTFPHAG